MPRVDVIKAQVSVTDRRRHKAVDRKRVAAYCRVSTDSEDQLNSYRSQVKYYTDKIGENRDWMMAGVYADEAITGTQVSKREGFQKMINDCMDGQIDMVITKSISRFARNTLDTLKYVRMLKEKNIAVFFEDENINTLSMDGELLLVVLSSVAQQEVENISSNVKKGLAMKMSRGEIVGFAGALGYDYDPDTKSLSVNEEEANIVRYIFKRYIEGMGAHVIARELEQMGALTGRGSKTWHDTTVLGIIKNEKYKGDLLQGKTFTVDPISKRRLDNLGEVDQYYVKNHHEAIIDEETWEQAQSLLKKRGACRKDANLDPTKYREKFSRQYAFSCMIKCGFCGASLTRRTWHSGSKYNKTTWLCMSASKYGKKNCPESKGIPEEALMSAFVESFRIITDDRKDVLEEFLQRTEEALSSTGTQLEIEKIKKELEFLDTKQKKLLDLHLDSKIDFGTYQDKKAELTKEQQLKTTELLQLQGEAGVEKDLHKRIDAMRKLLTEAPILKEFDRNVFESIVEKVIVGGYDDDGNADPYMITFVYKTGFEDRKNGEDFKPPRRNAAKNKLSQLPPDDVTSLSQHNSDDTCGDYIVVKSKKCLKIASFTQKTNEWVFEDNGKNGRKKVPVGTILVQAFINLVTVDMLYTGGREFKKKQIARLSKSFDGTLDDEEVMRVLMLNKTNFYKMKKEVEMSRGDED